jgi:hypothetical protein
VRTFGAALLAALEKKDAEALALSRAEHEHTLLTDITSVKERQVAEANASVANASVAALQTAPGGSPPAPAS